MRYDNPLKQRVRDCRLFDIYGSLLTEKQRRACESVLLSDLSLAETAELLSVTRQGVHDLLTRARDRMEALESELSIIERDDRVRGLAELIENRSGELPADFVEESLSLLRTQQKEK